VGDVLLLQELIARKASWRESKTTVVFTNGCFDLIHAGHVRYLAAARSLGGALVVGLNGDASVRRLKGPSRPIIPENERAEVLAAFECVDVVTVFDEETPLKLIEALTPDVLVKGGDWPLEAIIGREHVLSHGGRVLSLPLLEGRSTSSVISRIRGEST
jgi:D-beta-D-heptose 7-phosphate kinase/D-beta-D-heptose 1-phosphate adenosyltransferase